MIFIILLLVVAICYFLGAAWYLWLWLQLIKSEPSWVDSLLQSSGALLLAVIFWPIVVPICYSELLHSIIRHRREALGNAE